MIETQNGKYICFSHCQFTKNSLLMFFRYASSFVGRKYKDNGESITEKFGNAFLKILEQNEYSTLKEKLLTFNKAESELFSNNFELRTSKDKYESQFNYNYLRANNFTELEMFQLRDVFIKTQIEMYKDENNIIDKPKISVEPFFEICVGQNAAGPEFIASRNEPNENNVFSIEQVVGHSAKTIAEMIFNIIFIDDKRNSLCPIHDQKFDQLGFNSIISNFIFNKKTGDLLYNDKFSIQRDKKNFMLENPSVEQLIKGYNGKEYRKNGLSKMGKRGNITGIQRNLTSLNKTLSSMYDIGASEVSIIQNQIDAAKKDIMDSFTTEARRLTNSFAIERKRFMEASKGKTVNLSAAKKEKDNYSSAARDEMERLIDSFKAKKGHKQVPNSNETKSGHINIYTKIFHIIHLKIDALIGWVKSERNDLEKQVKEKFDQSESGIKTPKTKWLEIERSNLENRLKTDFDNFELDIQERTSHWFETEKGYVENIERILGVQNNSFDTSEPNKARKKRKSKNSLNHGHIAIENEVRRKLEALEAKLFGKPKNEAQHPGKRTTPNLENFDNPGIMSLS